MGKFWGVCSVQELLSWHWCVPGVYHLVWSLFWSWFYQDGLTAVVVSNAVFRYHGNTRQCSIISGFNTSWSETKIKVTTFWEVLWHCQMPARWHVLQLRFSFLFSIPHSVSIVTVLWISEDLFPSFSVFQPDGCKVS